MISGAAYTVLMSNATAPAFIVFDTETIPDGVLLARTRYAGMELSPEQAIERAQQEELERSGGTSNFIPVTFQIPVAVCLAPVGADYRLRGLHSLGAPEYATSAIVNSFWKTVNRYDLAKLVTFNGRTFDLPMLELAAFRYGISAPNYFGGRARNRFGDGHIDLMELLSNFGAIRFTGGLNLLSKLLGKPGKVDVKGDQVYEMFREGQLEAINEYCAFDVLDTYFVFLRTRVLIGALTIEAEQAIVRQTKDWLAREARERPGLQRYLDSWGDWDPWP
jgi:predicted PolB exonuclease-like 3'-5' exonuclease